MIRFELNERKAIEALVWLANEMPGITFYYIVKVLFFADKDHLNKYGRPILGDQYVAMPHGPVPSTIYDMLGLDRFLDPDLIQQVKEALIIDAPRVVPVPGRKPDMSVFSRSDIDCLKDSLRIYGHMPFGTLKRITHQEESYINAPANGEMNYLSMIDIGNPNRKEIEYNLKELSRYLSL
jgi:uncharacterized phage-associated protein